MAAPMDWTQLLTNTVAPLGGKILGETLAPDPSLMNAQQGQQNSQFNNALNLAKFNQGTQAKQLALPGMLKTLGYSPANADSAAANFGGATSNPGTTFGGPNLPTLGNAPSAPGMGSKIANTAIGTGLSVGVPLLAGALHGGAAAGAAGAAGAGAGAAGGGLGATLGALATNPVTWAAAGAIGAGLLWKKSQVHPTADQWVQGEQNPFDQTMANVDTQVKNGSMTPDEAKQLKTKNAQTYLSELQSFSQKGSHEAIVAKQAADTFRQWYGDPAQYGIRLSF